MRRQSAYRVFLTHNSEYHLRGTICCGVRDRRSGRFMDDHWALGGHLAQAFPDSDGQLRAVAMPLVGESLHLVIGPHDLHTSPILAVEDRGQAALEAALGVLPEATLSRRPPLDARETH